MRSEAGVNGLAARQEAVGAFQPRSTIRVRLQAAKIAPLAHRSLMPPCGYADRNIHPGQRMALEPSHPWKWTARTGKKVTHSPSLLENKPRKVRSEAEFKPVIVEMDAVLDAADDWVFALEALVAAQQRSEETEAESEVVDIAGSRLVVAVTRWRSR
jgi:hypothetical protein